MSARNFKAYRARKQVYFFVCQRRGVGQCFANIIGVEIRVVLYNFGGRHSICDKIDNKGDRNPHAPNAGTTSHHIGTECNSL